MTEMHILLIAIGLLVAYQVIAFRLSRSFQPLRLAIAKDGEELLADDRIPEAAKRRIGALMSWVFSPGIAWLVVGAFAWVAAKSLFRPPKGSYHDIPKDRMDQIDRVQRFSLMCILGNSPLALFLFLVLALIGLLFSPIDRLIRSGHSALSAAMDGKDRLLRH